VEVAEEVEVAVVVVEVLHIHKLGCCILEPDHNIHQNH
jgi:hypothetical protein